MTQNALMRHCKCEITKLCPNGMIYWKSIWGLVGEYKFSDQVGVPPWQFVPYLNLQFMTQNALMRHCKCEKNSVSQMA